MSRSNLYLCPLPPAPWLVTPDESKIYFFLCPSGPIRSSLATRSKSIFHFCHQLCSPLFFDSLYPFFVSSPSPPTRKQKGSGTTTKDDAKVKTSYHRPMCSFSPTTAPTGEATATTGELCTRHVSSLESTLSRHINPHAGTTTAIKTTPSTRSVSYPNSHHAVYFSSSSCCKVSF